MDNGIHVRFEAVDRSYFSILKKEIHAICKSIDFAPHRLAEIDIIISELSSNLVKHARQGEILVKIIGQDKPEGIEIITIDSGPGIERTQDMLRDGFSSTSTLGQGLGAINRLSDFLEIYSVPGWGTIFLCRIYLSNRYIAQTDAHIQFSSVVVAKTGESACGDGFYAKLSAKEIVLLVADGLGHGPDARLAVETAKHIFKSNDEQSPVEQLRILHQGIKKTRGMVATVVTYDALQKKCTIAGIGNISSRFYSPISKNLMSYNGIVGMNMPNTMNNQVIDIDNTQILILCSDGIRSRWDIIKFPGIFRYDLSILAAAIYRDYGRQTDDMSVYVLRLK